MRNFLTVVLFAASLHVCALKDTLIVPSSPRVIQAIPSRFEPGSRMGYRFLDVEQGLPSSYIMGAAQDSKGRMWFATDGGGVFSYDGLRFVWYGIEEGFPIPSGAHFMIDNQDAIWYSGSAIGVMRMHNGEIQLFRDEPLLEKTIAFIRKGKNEMVLFGAGQTVYSYSTGELHSFMPSGIPEKTSIRDLFYLSAKDQYLISSGDSLFLYTSDWELNSVRTQKARSFYPDEKGDLWVLTTDQLYNYENGKSFSIPKEIISSVMDIKILSDGQSIRIATWGEGVWEITEKMQWQFDQRSGLRSNRVYRIFSDVKGREWLCTDGGGLQVLAAPWLSHFSEDEGLTVPYIMSMAEVDGELWVGTRGGGLYKASTPDQLAFERIGVNQGLSSDYIYAIHQDITGAVWIGTHRDGAFVRRNGKFESIRLHEKETLNSVWEITSDNDGTIYYATFGGLIIESGAQRRALNTENGLPSDRIYSMKRDSAGIVWLGTSAGLARVDGENVQSFTRNDGMPDNIIWDIQISGDEVWMATHGGVVRLKNKQLKTWTIADGLITNMVWAIFKKGNQLWVGTERGVQFFTVQNDRIVPQRELGFRQGFTGNDVTPGSIFRDRNGKIWFGTSKQLTVYDPQMDQQQIAVPDVPRFDQLRIFQEISEPREWQMEPEQTVLGWPGKMIFPHHQNTLGFSFLSIETIMPDEILYHIIVLQDSDTLLNSISPQGEVTLTNLHPGSYRMMVRSSYNGTLWSEYGEMEFVIQKPFWSTWWFRLAALGLIILLIWGVFVVRTRALLAAQRKLEGLVRDRTAELSLKNDLLAEKNKEILDSMNYARRIQDALFASDEVLKNGLGEYFVFYQPRDVVSGDFYWVNHSENSPFLLCVADCTGHGVPGAFMSLLNIAFLNESVRERGLSSPDGILNSVRSDILNTLHQDGKSETNDGMDAVLLSLDLKNRMLHCALANNPLWIVRNGSLLEIKPDKMPVGSHHGELRSFTLQQFELQKGDMLYLFTDGFADQFGGPKGKKFKYAQLAVLLKEISNLDAETQKARLEQTFSTWRGDLEQNDDVLVVGVRV